MSVISEVYDIECLSNCFTYTGYDRKNNKYYQYVIHKSRNDYEQLITHITKTKGLVMIGYNNDNYDYPIIHHMINHYGEYTNMSGAELARKIYSKSQSIIESDFTVVADHNKYVFQIDLFKIWHFNNLARLTSLKNLEVALNLENVEDMPFDHRYEVETEEEIEKILSYNKSDVIATNKFLDVTQGETDISIYKGKNLLHLRYAIQKKYRIPCINYDNIKLGTELILKLYCEKFNKNPQIIRKLSTPRPIIKLKECFPQWMSFETSKFNKLISEFSETTIFDGDIKDKFKFYNIYNGIKIIYGAGGAHACIKPGVYNADEEYGIYDVDIDLI